MSTSIHKDHSSPIKGALEGPPNLRWPAEWEAQEAVWISWPHRSELWQGGLDELLGDYAKLAATIAPVAKVRINAAEPQHAAIARILQLQGLKEGQYQLYPHPCNDVWCRDHGGIFVQRRDGGRQIADWQFNAWGGKFAPWDLDNGIPKQMADSLRLPRLSSQIILEGGGIEGNGEGLILSTEAVLLNANRNPQASKADIEAELARMLGARSVFWLGQGIEGDDTDGHIDDMIRFVNAGSLVSIIEPDPQSPHYRALCENNERLQELRRPCGSKVEIIPLPMPKPLIAKDWRLEQLPASYANFLICNQRVIVPIFQQEKQDDRALGILREAFGTRYEVIGLDARRLVIEGGALHCITQQEPCAQKR